MLFNKSFSKATLMLATIALVSGMSISAAASIE